LRSQAKANWWPLWSALTACLLICSSLAVYVVYRRDQGRRLLAEARQMAQSGQINSLRRALELIRDAANLGGRSPEVIALAAAIHARLVVEFDESSLQTSKSLLDEVKRWSTPISPTASADLKLTRIRLALAQPLDPQGLARLRDWALNEPAARPYYIRALIHRGDLEQAARVAGRDTPHDAEAFAAQVELALARGSHETLARLSREARGVVWTEAQRLLAWARLEAANPKHLAGSEERLARLQNNQSLSRRERAWATLVRANLAHQRGAVARAQTNLRAALALEVNEPLFTAEVARSLLRQSRPDLAADQIAKAQEWSRENIRFRLIAAETALRRDELSRAATLLDTISPALEQQRLLAADLALKYGRRDRAQQLIDGLAPASEGRRILQARLALADGKHQQALRLLSQERGANAAFCRGRAAEGLSDLVRAAREYEAAITLDQLHLGARRSLARVQLRQGQWRLGKANLEKAVQLGQTSDLARRIRLELAELLLRLGEHAEADSHLRSDPSPGPDRDTLRAHALASVEQGQEQRAASLIAQLQQQGQINLARLFTLRQRMRSGRFADAARLAKEIDRRWLEADVQGMYWIAELYRRLGQLDRAHALYKRLARTPGNSADAWLGLSLIAWNRGQVTASLTLASQASDAIRREVVSRRTRLQIHLQLARCQRHVDNLGPAIAELQEALDLEPTNFTANLQLGQIYAELEKQGRAVQYLSVAVRANRKDEQARATLARLCRRLAPAPEGCR
jgi:tetratricopeptide (TPR) repeat protein